MSDVKTLLSTTYGNKSTAVFESFLNADKTDTSDDTRFVHTVLGGIISTKER